MNLSKWLKYGLIGAAIYPAVILFFTILSLVSVLSYFTEFILGLLLIPTLPFSDSLVLNCSLFLSSGFYGFRICFTLLSLIISCILGFIVGGIIGKIKK